MAAVAARTKTDRSKIDPGGGETGAKMLGGLIHGAAGSVAAAAAAEHRTTMKILSAASALQCLVPGIFIYCSLELRIHQQPYSQPVILGVLFRAGSALAQV